MVDVGNVPAVMTGNGDSWGGGLIGILLVIALLGGGGFGFGGKHGCGGINGGAEGRIENRLDFNWVREGQFHLSREIAENRFSTDRGFAAVIHGQDVNTGRILERMSQNELREAYAKIAEQGQLLSEQRITATILQNLQPPRAIPAYTVPNPFCGCGWDNNRFGCAG